MKPIAIILGFGAGLLGAIIWATISYYAHIQLGILAWGIGLAVGVGVAVGSKGQTSPLTGAVAAVIALASVLGGKYFTAWALVGSMTPTLTHCDDDSARVSIAGHIASAAEAAGKPLQWPSGMSANDAEKLDDYPKDIAKQAADQWAAMSAEQREKFRADFLATLNGQLKDMRGTVAVAAFKNSFTFLSIIFCVFAVLTAFRVGAGGSLSRS